jgi:hypothetical protein
MGWFENQKARNEAAKERGAARKEATKERKAAVIESFGRALVDVFDDRVEVHDKSPQIKASKNLPEVDGRRGWKVMTYDTGVEAGVISGDPGQAATQRLSATRLVGLGVFALAAPKKKGGSKPTALLVIANEAGQSALLTVDASKIADAKMVEIALNSAVERYKARSASDEKIASSASTR